MLELEERELLNRYCHGYVAVPVFLACKSHGLFKLLNNGALNARDIAGQLNANECHLSLALRLLNFLECLLRDASGKYYINPILSHVFDVISEDFQSLYDFSFVHYLNSNELSLKKWFDLSLNKWGKVMSPLWCDLLDGVLLAPLFVALQMHMNPITEHSFLKLAPSVQAELRQYFVSKVFCKDEGDETFEFTAAGEFLKTNSLNMGIAVSYLPLLRKISNVLFGDEKDVFTLDSLRLEEYVNKSLYKISSGFQREKYFHEVENVFLRIFNARPIGSQPEFIVDTRCGDGFLLRKLYNAICNNSQRGKALTDYPLKVVGLDCHKEDLKTAEKTLEEIPHDLLFGDVNNPNILLSVLTEKGVDLGKAVYIRSFLERCRTSDPSEDAFQVRSSIVCNGSSVYSDEKLVNPAEIVQSVVDCFHSWEPFVEEHGLVVLEALCIDPLLSQGYLDQCENIYSAAIQGFSQQYLVDADTFIMAAAEVGMFPHKKSFSSHRSFLPFTSITLGQFKKRPYLVRFATLNDVPSLIELEKACLPDPAQFSSAEIVKRIEKYSKGQCVVEIEEQVVGVVYSQRIFTVEELDGKNFLEVEKLHAPHGKIVQLLGMNILPKYQSIGLGNDILDFILLRCSLMTDINKVAGISRCKNYQKHADMEYEDYIFSRNHLGNLLDPVLQFHEYHGAQIKKVVYDYRPLDIENKKNGVLIEYCNL